MGNKQTRDPLEQVLTSCVTPEGNISFQKLEELKNCWKNALCNLAVVGPSGCGKSTLINNLLGVKVVIDPAALAKIEAEIRECKHDRPQTCRHSYAPTGSKETTKVPTPYTLGDSKVLLWDIPGFGSELYPSVENYWQQLNIDQYHGFLCLFQDNRRRANDDTVVEYLSKNSQKAIIWVRTHFDDVLQGYDSEDEDSNGLIEQVIAHQKKEALEFVVKLGIQQPTVCCVSGKYEANKKKKIKYKFDLDNLKAAIIRDMPAAQQVLLAKLFTGSSSELIHAKFSALQKEIVVTLLGSANTAAITSVVPIAGRAVSRNLDQIQVETFADSALQVYGLADNSILDSNSRQVVTTVNHQIEQIAKSNPGTFIMAADLLSSVAPAIGTALAIYLSSKELAGKLHLINCICRDGALQVLQNLNEFEKTK